MTSLDGTQGDDWIAAVPEGGKLVASVWDCGDDWCGCSEAQIEQHENDEKRERHCDFQLGSGPLQKLKLS